MSLFNLKKYINNILKENLDQDGQMVLWDWFQDNMPRMGFGHTEWQNKWFQERSWCKPLNKNVNLIVQVLPWSRNLGEIEDIEISVYGKGKLFQKANVPVSLKNKVRPENYPNFTFEQIIERIEFFIKQFEDDWKNEEFEEDQSPIWEFLMEELPKHNWQIDPLHRKDRRVWYRVFEENLNQTRHITRVFLLISPVDANNRRQLSQDTIFHIDLAEEYYQQERDRFIEVNNAQINLSNYTREEEVLIDLEQAIQYPLQFIERNP